MTVASKNIPYLAALDHVRAFAALLIFFSHGMHNFTRGIDRSLGEWIFPSNYLFAFFAEGHAAVSLFLVLSGFIFTYGAYGKEIDYWSFVKNRVLRIFPLFLAILLAAVYTYPTQFRFESLWATIMLMANTSAALSGGMFTILLWTISVEFAFYMVFPFLNAFLNSYGVKYLLLLAVTACVFRFLSIQLGANARDIAYFTIYGRIDQFLIGMIAAVLCKRGVIPIRARSFILISSAVLIFVSLVLFNKTGGWPVNKAYKLIWHTYEAVLFAAFIVSYMQFEDMLPVPYRNALSWVGQISFSIYLMHLPILYVFQTRWITQLTDDIFVGAFVKSLIALPCVLAVSWLTYLTVEKPFLSMRVKYTVAR